MDGHFAEWRSTGQVACGDFGALLRSLGEGQEAGDHNRLHNRRTGVIMSTEHFAGSVSAVGVAIEGEQAANDRSNALHMLKSREFGSQERSIEHATGVAYRYSPEFR